MSESSNTTAPASTELRRNPVGAADLFRVVLRQHRLALLVVTPLCLLAVLFLLLSANTDMGSLPRTGTWPYIVTEFALVLTFGFGGLIAVFWAAPLLPREYEAGTQVLVWSQDVAGRRLVWTTIGWLLLAACLLAVGLGAAAGALSAAQRLGDDFDGVLFGRTPLVQLGYASFGFGLGLVVGILARRTVLAMGLTAVLYIVVRFVVAVFARPHYASPVRLTTPLGAENYLPPVRFSMYLGSGLLDRTGNPVGATACPGGDTEVHLDCLREYGAVRSYVDFQPVARVGTFQLVETGIFVALAGLLLLLAWRLTRPGPRL